MPLDNELVLVFKSSLFGRWRVLAWREGEAGGSFLTIILGCPALPRLLKTDISSDLIWREEEEEGIPQLTTWETVSHPMEFFREG